MSNPLRSNIARHVWDAKYRLRDAQTQEHDIADTWRRVAFALASVEPRGAADWERRFFALLEDFQFLPAGRILAGAGTQRNVTLYNCFVMGSLKNSIEALLDALKEGAITMDQGGGVGYDFTSVSPQSVRGVACGAVPVMHLWDSLAAMLAGGPRRGAMMATLGCDHPDIERFVTAKRNRGTLTHFNLSVLVTDAFMRAVRNDDAWPLVFADEAAAEHGVRTLPARSLWETIARSAYDCAEPGVLFIDQINRMNNLGYRERITATNPCGEVPLPAYGACNLGSLNLTRFVEQPFSPAARIRTKDLAVAARTAVRMLDNVIELSRFPLPQQREQAQGTRRLGLGVTGLADALLMLGVRYDSDEACAMAESTMALICHSAYRASVALGEEKGPFPYLETERYLSAPFVAALPADLRDDIARRGIRNSHLTAIAPAGTISLLADGVSSGVEPIFAPRYQRAVLDAEGHHQVVDVEDYACRSWRELGHDGLPPALVDARHISARCQLELQSALQRHVDNAISKTVSVAQATDFESFRTIYDQAYDLGLKGCTVYRPNPVTGEILRVDEISSRAPHCCHIEREVD